MQIIGNGECAVCVTAGASTAAVVTAASIAVVLVVLVAATAAAVSSAAIGDSRSKKGSASCVANFTKHC